MCVNRTKAMGMAVLLAVAALLAGCGAQSPDQMLAAAKEALTKREYKAAAILIKNALQKQPESPEARFLLGQALMEAGDSANAELELRKARELRYSAEEVDPLLLRIYLATDRWAKVIEEAPNVRAFSPTAKANVLTYVGAAHFSLGNNKAAEKAIIDALAIQPDNRLATLAKARFTAYGSDYAAALKLVDQVLSKEPTDLEALRLKGDLFLALDQFDAAIGMYRKAIEVRPDFLGAHASLVFTMLTRPDLVAGSADFAEVEKQFEAMKKVAPTHPQTLSLQAQIEFQKKDFKAARESAQKLMQVTGNSPRAMQMAGAVEFALGSLTQAEALLGKSLQAAPDSIATRRWLAMTYLNSGQAARAVATLEPAIAALDKNAEMLALLGNGYMLVGDYKRAEDVLRKASRLQPEDPAKRTALAVARLNKGESNAAFAELEEISVSDKGTSADLALIANFIRLGDFAKTIKAIDGLEKKLPNSPMVANLRGDILLRMQDRASARKSFERAIAITPSFYPAAASLAEIDLAENKVESAANRFAQIIAADPKNVRALLALSVIKVRLKAPGAEITDLITKALAADRGDSGPRVALVDYYLSVSDVKKAVEAGQEALSTMPDRPEIHLAVGKAQVAAGELNQALVTYNKLSALLPNQAAPYIKMAEVQVASKDFSAAAASMRKALDVAPNLVPAQKILVGIELAAGKVQAALAVARTVQKQRPTEAIGYLLEGDIQVQLKSWDDAAAAFRAGLSNGASNELATRLHQSLIFGGKKAEAEKFALNWIKDHPKESDFRIYLGEAASGRGEYAVADAEYRAALAVRPDNANLLNNLAWVAAQLKQPEALAYAEKANQLAPKQPAYMDTLGMLLADKGEMGRALELLAEASRAAPQVAEIRLNYARLLVKAGKKPEARVELELLAKLGDKFRGQPEVAKLMKEL